MKIKSASQASIKVLFCCTGVGIFNRGIESFFRESFDGLKDAMPGVECRLIKGAGPSFEREKTVWCIPRTGKLADFLGRLIRRNAYVVEQWSSFPAIVLQIIKIKPDVIFYSDSNLGFQLYRWRRWIGVPYKLLFSNGGPIHAPFVRTDHVQQVAPLYLEEALQAGEPMEKHSMVPYGIDAGPPPKIDAEQKGQIRRKLGLPVERPIVLSVGWIAKQHKRMDYLIREVASMPAPRPFVQLLGAIDEESAEIIELGNLLLGPENFSVKSVPYSQVGDFYQAADCFVLASLKEGFGRVYLEALKHGLPTIAHRFPVMDFVLGDVGIQGDLNREGVLSKLLFEQISNISDQSSVKNRWKSVRDRFSWEVLTIEYAKMFHQVSLK
jgi:glycosyltransferase involved in cell wall biosynthesis